MLVMEYMEFGSLHDLIHTMGIPLEIDVMVPVLRDVSQVGAPHSYSHY